MLSTYSITHCCVTRRERVKIIKHSKYLFLSYVNYLNTDKCYASALNISNSLVILKMGQMGGYYLFQESSLQNVAVNLKRLLKVLK